MRTLFITLAAMLCLDCYAQIPFEKGYFIDNAGTTTTGLVRNVDWKNNPTSFVYKLSETSETQTKSMKDVQEFGISDVLKYRRFAVKIDRSSNQTEQLSNKRAPEFHDETLFLQVLVEGNASLYKYNDDGILRFFYSLDGAEATQLVYKEYRANNVRAINDSYKQQLFNSLKCPEITETDARKTAYTSSALIKYIKHYNECVQSAVKVYSEDSDRIIFNLSLRPGVVFSSLSMSNEFTGSNSLEFENSTSFRFGVEMELVLPFNNNRWSVVIEPTYQQFSSKTVEAGQNGGSIEYKSIELPFGVRRYFFNQSKTKMFMNGQYLFDVPLASTVDLNTGVEELKVKQNGSFAAGVGLNFMSKISVEARYQFNRQLFNGYTFIDTKHHGVAIIAGYTF